MKYVKAQKRVRTGSDGISPRIYLGITYVLPWYYLCITYVLPASTPPLPLHANPHLLAHSPPISNRRLRPFALEFALSLLSFPRSPRLCGQDSLLLFFVLSSFVFLRVFCVSAVNQGFFILVFRRVPLCPSWLRLFALCFLFFVLFYFLRVFCLSAEAPTFRRGEALCSYLSTQAHGKLK